MSSTLPSPTQPPRIPVIGIVGGIGAGKSAVARLFAARGCLVMDSDADARVALQRDDVRAALTGWWGHSILDAAGQVSRSAIAAIIFTDPAKRSDLESLIHPIIHMQRRTRIAAAAVSAPLPPAIIIDAPLLFEAGVDRECDAVIFVDSPLDQRQQRVHTRGWDDAELARREAAQMPLDAKLARSDFVINNVGSLVDLDRQVADVLDRVRRRCAQAALPSVNP